MTKGTQHIPVAAIAVDETGDDDRRCDHPDCAEAGDYRAPRSRSQLNAYYWFCLEHVRAYNAAWNYFTGMSRQDIERHQRDSVTWNRPTRPLGGAANAWSAATVRDAFGLFGEGESARPVGAASAPMDGRQQQARAALDLDASATLQEIKMRYKQLVKQHHPDANGGDKRSEERFKSISEAYSYLLSCVQS